MVRSALSNVLSIPKDKQSLAGPLHSTSHLRPYSRYAPYFQEPVYRPENLEQLYETGEAQKLAFVPVKAARNDENASVFHDTLLNYFINCSMKGGQKKLARSLVEQAFIKIKEVQLQRYYKAETDEARQKIECNPLNVLHKAVSNAKPLLQLTPIKRGGLVYQVPVPVSDQRATFLAVKWLVTASREKDRKVHYPEKLAAELLDAANNEGRVIKRKEDLHRQCEANRAYAHYRWG
nr:EOG090X0CZM [Eulimnadia texana]